MKRVEDDRGVVQNWKCDEIETDNHIMGEQLKKMS